MEKITFCPEDGEAVEFFVLEQTRLGGVDYILVTDSEDDDAEALILKDVSAPEDEEAIYSIVDDDKEMDAKQTKGNGCVVRALGRICGKQSTASCRAIPFPISTIFRCHRW